MGLIKNNIAAINYIIKVYKEDLKNNPDDKEKLEMLAYLEQKKARLEGLLD